MRPRPNNRTYRWDPSWLVRFRFRRRPAREAEVFLSFSVLRQGLSRHDFVLTFSMRVPRFVQWSYEIESSCADSSFTTFMSFSLFHFPSAFLQLIIWSIIFASRERSEEFYPFTIIFCSSSLSSHCLSNLKAFLFLVSLDMIMQVPDDDLIPTYGGIVLWNVETFHANLRSQEHNQDDTEHCRWSFCQPMTIDSMGIQASTIWYHLIKGKKWSIISSFSSFYLMVSCYFIQVSSHKPKTISSCGKMRKTFPNLASSF